MKKSIKKKKLFKKSPKKIARCESGELITASKATRGGKYFDILSNRELVIIKRMYSFDYFRFKVYNGNLNSVNESYIHKKMKIEFTKIIKSQFQEAKINYEQCLIKRRRADMVVKIGETLIPIEFQVSYITVREFIKRTADYMEAGFSPLWIFSLNQTNLKSFYQEKEYMIIKKLFHILSYQDSLYFMDYFGRVRTAFVTREKNKKTKGKLYFKKVAFDLTVKQIRLKDKYINLTCFENL